MRQITALTEELIERFQTKKLTPEEFLALDRYLQDHPEERARLTPLLTRSLMQTFQQEGLMPSGGAHLGDDEREAYLAGELTGATLERAHQHLAVCARCREDLEALRNFADELAGQQRLARIVPAPLSPAPPSLFRSGLFFSLGGALTGAAAVLLWIAVTSPASSPGLAGNTPPENRQELTRLRQRSEAKDRELEQLQTRLAAQKAQLDKENQRYQKAQSELAALRRKAQSPAAENPVSASPTPPTPPTPPDPLETRIARTAERILKGTLPAELIAANTRTTEPVVRRGAGFHILEPQSGVVLSTRPRLRWTALEQGSQRPRVQYRVTLKNASGAVVETVVLPPSPWEPEWRPERPLARGKEYTVTVQAETTDGSPYISEQPEDEDQPLPPAVARFKVLDRASAEKIAGERLALAGRSLALGLRDEGVASLNFLKEYAPDTPAGKQAESLFNRLNPSKTEPAVP